MELAYTVIEHSGLQVKRIAPRCTVDRSEEYWMGWALAYYQWETALSFNEIIRCVPINEIKALYYPYHEMDIRQFSDRMNELIRHAQPETNLGRLRKKEA